MSASVKKLPAIGAVLLAAVIVLAWHWLSSVPIDKLISQARLAVERRDARTAEELCARILEREPENPEGLLLSALISAETGRFSDAVEFCTRVPQDSGKSFIDSRIMAGNICIEQLGLVTRSEQFFGELLAIQPDHTVANDRMVYLLGLQSRIRELIPYYLRVLRKSPRAAVKIQLLMQGELAYPDLDLTQQLQKSDPTCAGLVLAEAHLAFLSKDYATAENLCRQAVKMQPDFAEAQARLGLVLLQTGTAGPLKAWCAALPGSVKQHPEILYVTGRIALLDHLLDEATRCFWE